MPRSSMGSASVQRSGLGWAFRDAFNCQWNRSISPFVIGWYDVVRVRIEPKSCISFLHSTDSNWRPRSVVAVDGVPNLDIHPLTNALATVSALMSNIGMASGHLSVDAGEDVCVTVRRRKRPHNVEMNLVKSNVRCCKSGEWDDCMSLHLWPLALKTGSCPSPDISIDARPHISGS